MSAKLIEINTLKDNRGCLGVIDERELPFHVKRIYFLYNVPKGNTRGAHGHRNLKQFFICLSGSVVVTIDDGKNSQEYKLVKGARGLFVPQMHWRELSMFSDDAVVLVLASEPYCAEDYIHSYDEFKRLAEKTA